MRAFAPLFAMLLAASPASAQDVSLSEAIRLAQARAPSVRAAGRWGAVARARADEVRAEYLPNVNAAAVGTAGFGGSSSGLGVRGLMNSPYFSHFAAGVEGSWSALEPLRTGPRIDAARSEERAAGALGARAERDVALVVLDAYERTLVAEANIEVLDGDLAARRAHLDAMRALVSAGRAAGVETLQVEAGIARAEATRATLDAEREAARATLGILTGDARMSSAALRLDSQRSAAVDPDAETARARRAQAGHLREAPARELLPRVILAASAGYAHPEASEDPGLWSAGVAVVVPLTAIFRERARADTVALTAEAQADEADARSQGLQMERASLRAVGRALARALPAAEAGTAASRAALEALEARAVAGLAAEVDVEMSRTVLAQSRAHEAVLRVRLTSVGARLALVGER